MKFSIKDFFSGFTQETSELYENSKYLKCNKLNQSQRSNSAPTFSPSI